MNAADSHRHQLLPSKMHLFAPLARSSRHTSLKRGWKHLKKHPGSPGKASAVLAPFYLQALAGEMVPKVFWGCSMGKTLIGIISLVAAVTELSSPITETHPGELWLLGFLEMPKIGEKPWWKSLGCFSRHHLAPGSGEVEDEPRRDPKSCRDPSPTRASYREVGPKRPREEKMGLIRGRAGRDRPLEVLGGKRGEIEDIRLKSHGSGSGLCLRGLCGVHRAQPRQSCFPSSSGLKLVFFFFFSFSPLYIWESLKAKLPEDAHKS